MQKYLFKLCLIVILSTLFFACKRKTIELDLEKYELIEEFADSTQIGNRGLTKVQISRLSNESNANCYISVKVFTKKHNGWELVQNDSIVSNGVVLFRPEFKDYNADGFTDLAFVSNVGANLANYEYRVFLYQNHSKKLKEIGKGWNLRYSEKLNMFREKYIASGTTCSFYKLVADTLAKAYEIDLSSTHEFINEFDTSGKLVKADTNYVDLETETLPELKHWIRVWALKDSLE